MEFNRLSEVEKLAEVPAGASALAESDGKIVRVPFGGGDAKLEDMMFDLEVEVPSNGQLAFTNKEQIQKVYDNNMSVYIVCCEETSGGMRAYKCSHPFVKDTLPVLVNSAGIVFAGGNYNHRNTGWYGVSIYFDPDKYNQDGTLEVKDGSYMVYPSSITVVRAYASIF